MYTQTPGNSSLVSTSAGACSELPGSHLPALTCAPCRPSAALQSSSVPSTFCLHQRCWLLSHTIASWEKDPQQQCSQLPKDALTDAKLCTAEPECVQEDRTLTSDHGLPSLQVRISPLMYLLAMPELSAAANTKRPQCLLGKNPLSWKEQAQPTKNMFEELERAHCIQSGPSKGNNGVFRLESVCSFTFLIREVPCSNVQPKTWVISPQRRLSWGTVILERDHHSLQKLASELSQKLETR